MENPQKISLDSKVPNWKNLINISALFLICCVLGGIFAYFMTGKNSPNELKLIQIKTKESSKVYKRNKKQSLEKNLGSANFPNSSDLSYGSFLQGKKKLDSAIIKLQAMDKIADPQKGLAMTTQAIAELKQSKKILLSIKEKNLTYQDSQSYISYAENSIKIAEEWKQFFVEQENQSNLEHQSIQQDKKTTKRVFPELSIKHKASFLLAMQNKTVALTFDDGPTREYTPQILDILRKNNIRATFFVVGKRVRENCDIVREIYQSGHEIGNHTDTHPYLTKVSQSQQILEIINVQRSVSQCLGFEYPINWFRAPYGDQNQDLLNIIHQLNLSSVQWTIDTHDWKKTSSSFSIKNMVKESFNSAVVLMHDGSKPNPNFQHPNENLSRQNTVNALQPMINILRKRGFTFVNLSDAFK